MSQAFKVFIDGEAGTTGLQIRQRLDNHPDINVVSIDTALRKNTQAKLALMAEVDITVFCLPDEAAIETAQLAQTHLPEARILDASSAHRTHPDWVYGLPELQPQQREAIKDAKRVSNPGCYATGANLILRPLSQYLDDYFVQINAVSGYTGGGNQLVAHYQNAPKDLSQAPALGLYGLDFNHKHIPEISKWAQLQRTPVFIPSVADLPQGMLVHSVFNHKQLPASINNSQAIHAVLADYYAQEHNIEVKALGQFETPDSKFLTPHHIAGQNICQLYTYGSTDCTLVVAKLDNLGKGASGACVQNLNIMLGLEESIAVGL